MYEFYYLLQNVHGLVAWTLISFVSRRVLLDLAMLVLVLTTLSQATYLSSA
jgi:hypothetical protein